VVNWYIFLRFGVLHQGKSGNPAYERSVYPIKVRTCFVSNDVITEVQLLTIKHNVHGYVNQPGGVAQLISHPPQEQEDPGSNPAWVKGFRQT
jgi:hypothetical protein